jgi:WD40 repeat protein
MAQRNVKVRDIKDVSGEVNVAGRDIIKNIKTIYQRALTAAEEAAWGREIETKLLAQGVSLLAQSLSIQASQSTENDSPYKGLLAYSLNEAEIFFGRNKAKNDLLKCIKQDSLTVLHAESGAGKSSLLQAGIAAHLIAEGHLAIRLRSRDADPVDFIKRTFLPELSQTPALVKASLREFLRQVCTILGSKVNLYLLLDQFEEFFNLLTKEERQPFLKSLTDCLNDSSLKVRWVLALRAEALSDLAELESFGITPFKNTYRLNRLSRAEAQVAIIEPAQRYGITFEQTLIDHIVETLTLNNEVTPTHLQLVCSALTDDLPEDKLLTLAYYTEHEGGTEGILRDYLKRQLEHLPNEEQVPAWKVLRALITADRRRAVKTYDEIVAELKLSGVSREQIDTILVRLVERRLLATQPTATETFELAHDYLVKEIELDPQEQARKAAQELLDQEVRTYNRYKTLISPEHLTVIEPYRTQLNLSPLANGVLVMSIVERERQKQARERLTRRIGYGLVSFSLILLALLVFVLIQLNNSRAQQLGSQAQNAFAEQNYNIAALYAYQSNQIHHNTFADSVLSELYYENFVTGRSLIAHTGAVNSVAWSKDGRLASGSNHGTTIIWDLSTGQPGQILTETLVEAEITSVAWSNDGHLASGSNDGTVIVWDLKTGEPAQTLRSSTNGSPITSVAWSADEHLASGSSDGTIIVWDLITSQPAQTLRRPQNGSSVTSIAWSVDGHLASGTDDHSVIVWDLPTSQPALILTGHTDSVNSIAWSADGRLASGSKDGTIRIWNLGTGQPSQTLEYSDVINSVTWSADGHLASAAGDNTVTIWDLTSGLPAQTLRGHTRNVTSIAWSTNGHLASASEDTTVIVWDPAADQVAQTLKGHTVGVTSVAWSRDGRLASASQDSTVTVWNLHTGQPDRVLKGHTKWVDSVAWSADGRLASAAQDGTVIIWNLSTGQPDQILKGSTDWITSIAWSADGRLASSLGDGTIVIWNLTTGQPDQIFKCPVEEYSFSVAWSLDSQLLASGLTNGTVLVWNVATGQPAWTLTTNDIYPIASVAWSRQGQLAAGSTNQNVYVWEKVSSPSAQIFEGHTHFITSVAWSEKGRLASAANDGKVIVWDSVTHQPAQVLRRQTSSATSIGWSVDGRLASGSVFGSINIARADLLRVPPCEWIFRNMTMSEWSSDEGIIFVYQPACPNLASPQMDVLSQAIYTWKGRAFLLGVLVILIALFRAAGKH